jgi:hypothetical protein
MADTPLAKKLHIAPGSRMLILNAPGRYLDSLAPLPQGVETATEPADMFDVVQLFTRDTAELERSVAAALGAIRPGGLLWICWPKKSAQVSSDLDRDSLWAALHARGWSGVASVSVDDTWSALRFRPTEDVGR